jgi:carboxypeptidase Taq
MCIGQSVRWAIFRRIRWAIFCRLQLWERALQDEPSIPKEIANGRFSPLLGWLRENVHRHGRKFPPRVLVERATGRGLDVAPYGRLPETQVR